MIENTLSKAQANELFSREAVLFGLNEGIPEYRVAELFGEQVSAWAEGCMKFKGYLVVGEDYNVRGSGGEGRPMVNYFYRSGFLKIVSEHNYQVTVQRHGASEGGAIVDALWKAREDLLAAQDAEAERKRQERREKRAATRKAKQEAAEKVSA